MNVYEIYLDGVIIAMALFVVTLAAAAWYSRAK
jgi:hypothetical protein